MEGNKGISNRFAYYTECDHPGKIKSSKFVKYNLPDVINDYSQGKYKEAFEAFNELEKISPNRTVELYLGIMYLNGQFVEKNPELAFNWVVKSVNNGEFSACAMLAAMYYDGTGVKQDFDQAFKLFSYVSQHGQTALLVRDAEYCLAEIYEHGRGTQQKSPEMALAYYKQSAEHGNIRAKRRLANMYHNGQGVAQNTKEAVRLLKEIINDGPTSGFSDSEWKILSTTNKQVVDLLNETVTGAYNLLGLIHLSGQSGDRDYLAAKACFLEACKGKGAAVISAHYNMGFMFHHGLGTPPDPSITQLYFKEAVRLGGTLGDNINGFHQKLLEIGREHFKNKNYTAAHFQFLCLAQGNVPEAKTHLAQMKREGLYT